MVLLVMLIGVPFAPNVAEVLLPTLPLPPSTAMPSALGKFVIVLLLMLPVVKCAVVAPEPWGAIRMPVPNETAAFVELVSVLFVIVRLLIVPVPFSIWMPWRRALFSMFCVIDTTPLSELVVNVPLSLNEMLLSSCGPIAAVPTLLMVELASVKFVTPCPSTPLRPAFWIL